MAEATCRLCDGFLGCGSCDFRGHARRERRRNAWIKAQRLKVEHSRRRAGSTSSSVGANGEAHTPEPLSKLGRQSARPAETADGRFEVREIGSLRTVPQEMGRPGLELPRDEVCEREVGRKPTLAKFGPLTIGLTLVNFGPESST